MNTVLYLAAGQALLNCNCNVVYQDKFIKRDLNGDMLDIDLNGYDLIIASPPCNYYSKANYRRNESIYSLETKNLLPDIIKKLELLNVPIIIENVINKSLMKNIIHNTKLFYYEYGRHCYFTNRLFNFNGIPQVKDKLLALQSYKKFGSTRQGGFNVNIVFEYFINVYLDNI
jgi:site-specific DNA-cytosine methylase